MAYGNSVHAHKLDKIQNRALRIISGAICSTPIRALEIETNIIPLSLRRLDLAQRYCLKLISSSHNDFIVNKITRGIIPVVNMFNSTADLNLNSSNKLIDIYFYIHNTYHNTFKSFVHWPCYTGTYYSKSTEIPICSLPVYNTVEFLEYLNNHCEYYCLYTDGSKSDESVHSAIFDPCTNFKQSFRLDNNCSVFTAESYAVLKALHYISSVNNHKKFLILTDSLSLINSVEKLEFRYRKNFIIYAIREALYNLKVKYDVIVKLKWIASHSRINGNEIADDIARRGINEVDLRATTKVPLTDSQSNTKVKIKQAWYEFWQLDQVQNGKGKWYGSIQTSLPCKPWYADPKYKEASRDFITTINRLRFGHHKTPSHLARINIISSNICPYCNSDIGDINHFIFKCPQFNLQRLVLASDLCDSDNCNNSDESAQINPVPRRLQELLKTDNYYVHLYKFIKNTIGNI